MRRFQEILVLASPADEMASIVARAAELAERNRARLTIFDVVPELGARSRRIDSGGSEIDLQDLLVEARRRELAQLAGVVMTVETRVAVSTGVRFVEVVRRVQEYHHDLLITAPDREPSGRGLGGATTTLHLLRKCPVPVWVDDPQTWGRRDVVVAVGPFADDGEIGALDRTLMELATSLASVQRGKVHVVHAWRFEGEQLLRSGRGRLRSAEVDALVETERAVAEKSFRRLLDDFDAFAGSIESYLRHGKAPHVIGEIVETVKPGVVVMGTVARTGLSGLIIGNTAERLLGDLEASVLAVKPPGFVSPVGPR